jgi:phosphatidylglycerol:prolipoprotein diacylglycerol transferase
MAHEWTYAWFLGAALAVVVAGSLIAAHRCPPWSQWRELSAVLAAAFAALLGARLLYLALHWEGAGHAWRELVDWRRGGFSLTGGIALAAVVGYAASRGLGSCPWRLADALIPAVGIAIALMRLGCYLEGCCYGQVSNLPWAVRYSPNSPAYVEHLRRGLLFLSPQSLPVHPTQLYEAAAALVIALAGRARLHRSTLAPGTVALGCGIAFLAVHAFNFALRSLGSLPPHHAWLPPALDGLLLAGMLPLFRSRLRAGSTQTG